MDSPRNRLVLGIAAVAFLAGLCLVVVGSARGRLPAPSIAAAPADPALRSENLRLRAEVARLKAERDSARAAEPVATASPVPPMTPAAAPRQPEMEPRQPAAAPAAPRHESSAPQRPDGFAEPQTFTSVSTSN